MIGTLLFHLDPPQSSGKPASVRWGGKLYYQRQRDLAYNYVLGADRVPIPPAHTHTRPRVLIIEKPVLEPRRFANTGSVLPALQARFPNVEFLPMFLEDLSARDQLKMLSETTILVSTSGSASMRLIYLPTGAHAIITSYPIVKTITKEVATEQQRLWGMVRSPASITGCRGLTVMYLQ